MIAHVGVVLATTHTTQDNTLNQYELRYAFYDFLTT